MHDEHKIVTVHGIDYAVFDFKYASGNINGEDYFFLFEDTKLKYKKAKTGQVFIMIPTFVEMQDLYVASCEKDIETKKYVVNKLYLKLYKIRFFCDKIVDCDGDIIKLNNDMVLNLYPSFGNWLLTKIDFIIYKYYLAYGLDKEMETFISESSYQYYRAIQKKKYNEDDKTPIPPPPGVVVLKNIYEMFSCTPDEARRTNKRYLDMITLAQEQKNLIEEHPEIIGLSPKINSRRGRR